jgi:two-component system response regulator (stage 0 sporulation protein A)
MAQNKVVILQDNDLSIEALKGAISELDGFEVVGASTDGEKGIEIIKSVEPEFVILGIVLKNVDGFGVMESICKNEQKPKMLVVSSFTSENVISRALSSGAVYYIAKPFKREIIKNRLLELSGKGEIKESAGIEKRKNTLDERISKIFIAVGIPPHIKGYYYLREGVKMAVENPEIINNITKKLYPMIGEKFQTTASKVERAIRHAIEVACNRGRIETINTLLGIRAYSASDKPTNGEFIALIADKMLLEGA